MVRFSHTASGQPYAPVDGDGCVCSPMSSERGGTSSTFIHGASIVGFNQTRCLSTRGETALSLQPHSGGEDDGESIVRFPTRTEPAYRPRPSGGVCCRHRCHSSADG